MPRLPFLSLTCAIAFSVAACDRQSADEAQQQENSAEVKANEELTGTVDRSQAGTPLPAVTVTDPSGTTLDLSKAVGKPVLLNLWATWCAPCVAEMPLLDELAAERADTLRVLTVSEDMKGPELVVPFFKEKKFANLPQWMDQANDLAFGMGGGASLPLTVLYDAEGKEVWRVIGGFDWASDQAREMLDEAAPPADG
ncbi:redoxin family protein [Altererythrobacter salegens]|uniref:Redoxin family protein n=1 Tax=Croceibacterium salegens TaxID=1737568 RepID=A0A6I4STQ0_9SPHN|nr:redoxin family protein [Croceibacterium salegens]